MKKILNFMAAILAVTLFASCASEKEEPITDGEQETLSGFYIIGAGNMSAKIPSAITVYNSETGTVTPALEDAFMQVNGVALGEGARPALIYESKMYIPMTDSNLIWVVEPETLKIIGRIIPEGDAEGPREVVAANGKIYASMFSGYVCQINPETLAIEKTIKTGPNSEQMVVAEGKLYVANSDGYNYAGEYADCSISIIDLKTFEETKIKDITKVLNPTDMATNGKEVFVLCKGNYGDVPSMVKKIVGKEVIDVAEGNIMAVNGNKLYVINSPFGIAREDMAFDVYNTITLGKEGIIVNQTEGTESWIESPSHIFVDSVSGDIVIISYTLSEAGYSQYKEPCYANIYDNAGNFKKRIQCCVDALGVTFLHKK